MSLVGFEIKKMKYNGSFWQHIPEEYFKFDEESKAKETAKMYQCFGMKVEFVILTDDRYDKTSPIKTESTNPMFYDILEYYNKQLN